MQQRYVGTSGLQVSELGLGTMSWGQETDEEAAADSLKTFLEAGGTLIDTAAGYSDGRSEAILGSMLGDVVARPDVVIVSKAGISRHNGARQVDLSRRAMLDSLDATLARLGTDHLDLWLAHTWDPHVPLEETLSALELAVATGRTRYAGVSNHNGWQLARAVSLSNVPLVANQTEYSLVRRAVEREVVPATEALGVGTLAWGPLGRGVLTGKYRSSVPTGSRAASDRLAEYVAPYLAGRPERVTEALLTAARGLDRQPMEVALAWLLQQRTLAAAVVGARTPAQLKEAVSANTGALPEQIAEVLDEVSALPD
ncbi:aldo/keto reductase [Arthrobacter castelli]|uniref:aldo/keto reductase n=1 Tax=Arthrobacter castelli TaxID=271431 RepID=UPI00041BF97D|nr:aldo/keto reductase [Arthrobacter castelli]